LSENKYNAIEINTVCKIYCGNGQLGHIPTQLRLIVNAPVIILPVRAGGGGGGHTRGFRQKTIPDRREFDKLMESGSRVIDFDQFLHPGHLMHQAAPRVGI